MLDHRTDLNNRLRAVHTPVVGVTDSVGEFIVRVAAVTGSQRFPVQLHLGLVIIRAGDMLRKTVPQRSIGVVIYTASVVEDIVAYAVLVIYRAGSVVVRVVIYRVILLVVAAAVTIVVKVVTVGEVPVDRASRRTSGCGSIYRQACGPP